MQIVIALLLITVINILVQQFRVSHTAARDTRRLRIALTAEIGELSALILANLDRVRSGKTYLLSLRACTFVYRGSIGRLGFVPDRALAPVVGAYAICEQAEHLVAATTKAHGPMAFEIIDNETPLDEIVAELERAEAALQKAVVCLMRAGEPAEPAA